MSCYKKKSEGAVSINDVAVSVIWNSTFSCFQISRIYDKQFVHSFKNRNTHVVKLDLKEKSFKLNKLTRLLKNNFNKISTYSFNELRSILTNARQSEIIADILTKVKLRVNRNAKLLLGLANLAGVRVD